MILALLLRLVASIVDRIARWVFPDSFDDPLGSKEWQ